MSIEVNGKVKLNVTLGNGNASVEQKPKADEEKSVFETKDTKTTDAPKAAPEETKEEKGSRWNPMNWFGGDDEEVNAEDKTAAPDAAPEEPKEEKGSMWNPLNWFGGDDEEKTAEENEAPKAGVIDTAKEVLAPVGKAVNYVKEETGWNDMIRAQDRADGRVELITKNTKYGWGYLPALAANFTAQVPDVNSYVSEKITVTTEKLDAAVEKTAPKEVKDNGDKAHQAGSDILKSFTAPVKIFNGVLNLSGGASDVTSSYLKTEDTTNKLIMDSTKKTIGNIADSLKDYSIENINDKKTLIEVGTRLGMSKEQLEKLEDEKGTDHVRQMIRYEYDVALATGKINKETILVTAANASAAAQIQKNTDMMIHQREAGCEKLGKGQLQFRQGVSNLTNLPAAVLDLTNAGINAGIKSFAGEGVADAVSAPLNTGAGLLQMVTTSFDGKEGTTKAAGQKFLKGITFGWYNPDEKPADETKANETKANETKANETTAKADEVAPKTDAEKPAENEEEQGSMWNPFNWFGGKTDSEKKTDKFKEEKAKELKAEFETKKKEAMLSEEALQSRAEVAVDEVSAKKARTLITAAWTGKTEEERNKAYSEFLAHQKTAAANRKDNIEKAKAQLAPTMEARLQKAEEEAAKLIKDGKIDLADARRIAQMAENAGVAGTAFWNNWVDSVYSNADNTAGARGGWANALSMGKGFISMPLKALLKEGVTTADKVVGGMACHEIGGAIIAGYTAVKKGKEAIAEVSNATYNSALKQAGYEKVGEAVAYATLSTALAIPGAITDGHCWHFIKHGERVHWGCGGHDKAVTLTPDDIFLGGGGGPGDFLLPAGF